MYEYAKGNYIYRGTKECGTPLREIKTISQKEANYWDRVEREIRRNKMK